MPTAQKQPVLEDGQIDESRKPQYHQERIDRKHGVFVKEAAAVLAMVGDGQRWIEEEIRQRKNSQDANCEGKDDCSWSVGVYSMAMVP